MKTKRKLLWIPAVFLAAVILLTTGLFLFFRYGNYGFAKTVPFTEQLQRLVTVHTAQCWLGTEEGSDNHKKILEIYNNHSPLARGYAVSENDSWCATFGSCVAIQRRLTDIIPTECGCERQIELWKEAGKWEENDSYLPLPGDFIYYDWDISVTSRDCTGWSDHVGIVVGTLGPFIKVIEGNKDDMVDYRIIPRGYLQIRGFGLPDYASKLP